MLAGPEGYVNQIIKDSKAGQLRALLASEYRALEP